MKKGSIERVPLTESDEVFSAALRLAGEDFWRFGARYYSVARIAEALDLLPAVLQSWCSTVWPVRKVFSGVQCEICLDKRGRIYLSDHAASRIRDTLKRFPILPHLLSDSHTKFIDPDRPCSSRKRASNLRTPKQH